ncbi:MAG TPA: hypothetical protein VMF65_10560 [Acidimicrobiales bacterium]|nr:hypothetical protein [Acidimicrobiales bacterium]
MTALDGESAGEAVSPEEVLTLWRALLRFRSGGRPACAPRGKLHRSECPLYVSCPRWRESNDKELTVYEDFDATERRRSSWPCSRLLDVLDTRVSWVGQREVL